jgi:hypothetical protein
VPLPGAGSRRLEGALFNPSGALSLDATQWGLCGGMAFLTRDFVEASRSQLAPVIHPGSHWP